MNPNASTFVPSTKMDATEQKKYEQQHLLQQIGATKKDLSEQNAKLVMLHSKLNETYDVLCRKVDKDKDDKYSETEQQIESLHSKYTQQSQLYYKQYSRFNDLNATLVYLQQKLHRLLLSSASSPAASPPILSIDNETDSTSITTEDNDCNNSSSPSSPSFNVLPPILEEEEEEELFDDKEEEREEEEEVLDDKEEEEEEVSSSIVIVNDYVKLENKIDIMLDNIWNSDIQTICNQFRVFIFSNCMNCKTIEILVNCIIIHAVNNKPVFFGAKYSVLCQSIIAYLNEKLHFDSRAIAVDLFELIWSCCYDTFRKLQFGNNSEKFINIMIIMAELLNANLLTPEHVFQYIFKGILCKNDAEEVCENDIEGIYEIFKRCAPSLTSEAYRHELDKYLSIMHNIKTWRKFHNGINKVPFMINEIQNISDNYTQ